MYIQNWTDPVSQGNKDKQVKKKKIKAKKKKDSQLLIRVNGEERDRFVQICEQIDTSAAREIRRFMRDFIAEHDES